MKYKILLLLLLAVFAGNAQENNFSNATNKLLSKTDEKITIGGYAQIDYNQAIDNDTYQNGKLDVHRMVLLFGYNFSDKTQFVTELELEHVTEVYVEQAWINHRISNGLNFRGGLMLVPMGLINEYHEPPTFNGVERPSVDKYIVPTTWREIGAGINGYFSSTGISYQAYLLNGFNGYNGSAKLGGKSGLRSGRQKGAESYISSPNLALKANWNAIPGLKIGVSGYFGKTQSTLYNELNKNDAAAKAQADSSVVGISMLGIDGVYAIDNFEFRAQYIHATLSNTKAYNRFTGSDVGSALQGFYVEGAYNFKLKNENEYVLSPFVRYENYNTHLKVDDSLTLNDAYNRSEITMGVTFQLSRGAVLKADYQLLSNAATTESNTQLNLGIGIWF
ncbi:MAG: hypothetical protein PF541_11665 [Prolixibacteraceae bacterium]|jgi:hypothetical protein|nr:hypothetical protein [Prolixibacteraceae bacterium]